MCPVEIPWEWELLLSFHGNGKGHGNGLLGMGGNVNRTYSYSPNFSQLAKSLYVYCRAWLSSGNVNGLPFLHDNLLQTVQAALYKCA